MKTSTPTVTITCPDWCTEDPQEHADGLADWEGRVGHSSDWVGDFRITSWTNPDGMPWPDEGDPKVGIFSGDRWYTAEEVEALANALLELAATLRRELEADVSQEGIDR